MTSLFITARGIRMSATFFDRITNHDDEDGDQDDVDAENKLRWQLPVLIKILGAVFTFSIHSSLMLGSSLPSPIVCDATLQSHHIIVCIVIDRHHHHFHRHHHLYLPPSPMAYIAG